MRADEDIGPYTAVRADEPARGTPDPYGGKAADGSAEDIGPYGKVVRSMESIIVAVISGAVTLVGVLIANGKAQAVTETRLDELTREVREHNNFARRMPVVEEQVKVINHRLEDLEAFHRP